MFAWMMWLTAKTLYPRMIRPQKWEDIDPT